MRGLRVGASLYALNNVTKAIRPQKARVINPVPIYHNSTPVKTLTSFLFGEQLKSRHVIQKKRIITPVVAAAAGRQFSGLGGRKKAAPKTKTHWVCEDCGESYTQWWGQCRNCKAMNSLKEFKEAVGSEGKRGGAGARAVENLVLSQQASVGN